jgi:hypothetical protein
MTNRHRANTPHSAEMRKSTELQDTTSDVRRDSTNGPNGPGHIHTTTPDHPYILGPTRATPVRYGRASQPSRTAPAGLPPHARVDHLALASRRPARRKTWRHWRGCRDAGAVRTVRVQAAAPVQAACGKRAAVSQRCV